MATLNFSWFMLIHSFKNIKIMIKNNRERLRSMIVDCIWFRCLCEQFPRADFRGVCQDSDSLAATCCVVALSRVSTCGVRVCETARHDVTAR